MQIANNIFGGRRKNTFELPIRQIPDLPYQMPLPPPTRPGNANHNLYSLTQRVLGPELVQAAELVVTIQDGGASHDGHQDHVGRIELALLICIATAAVRAPAPSGARLPVTGHRSVATAAGLPLATSSVHADGLQVIGRLEHHAQGQRDHGHDHLPRVRRTELAVRPKELSRHGGRVVRLAAGHLTLAARSVVKPRLTVHGLRGSWKGRREEEVLWLFNGFQFN